MNTKIILGDRQTGKTTELIKQSVALGAPILCQYKDEPDLIRDIARQSSVPVPETIMVDDIFEQKARCDVSNGVCIDDPLSLLSALLNYANIAAVAVNLSDVTNTQLLTIENASHRKSSTK